MITQLDIFYSVFMRMDHMAKMKADFIDFLMQGHCEPCWSQLPLSLTQQNIHLQPYLLHCRCRLSIKQDPCLPHIYIPWAERSAWHRADVQLIFVGSVNEWINEWVSWVRKSLEASIISPKKQRQAWHILENFPSLKWFKYQSPWVKS